MTASALLHACATTPALREQDDLRAELRAIRAENQKLEQRLERLELSRSVGQSVQAAPQTKVLALPAVTPALPALTVVKLKPKAEAAPSIDLHTSVVEPSQDAVADLKLPELEGEPEVGELVFTHGVNALKTGNVEGGVAELVRFAEESPKHAKADNALYFAGLGQLGLDEPEAASKSFEQVIAKYPAGDAVVDAMLKLAECRVRLHRVKDARKMYEKIVSAWPGTAAATQAQSKLGSLPASP